MKLTFVIACLLTFPLTVLSVKVGKAQVRTTSFLQALEETKHLRNSTSHRKLFLTKACTNLVNNTLGSIIPLTDCNCEPVVVPPSISLICQGTDPFCLVPPKVLCGVPGIGVSLDLVNLLTGGLPVVLEVCFNDVTIFGIEIPEIIPFCVSPGGSILTILTGGIIGLDSVEAENKVEADSTDICTARLGDDECYSCTVCDPSIGSILINCTNVVPGLISPECTSLPFFT